MQDKIQVEMKLTVINQNEKCSTESLLTRQAALPKMILIKGSILNLFFAGTETSFKVDDIAYSERKSCVQVHISPTDKATVLGVLTNMDKAVKKEWSYITNNNTPTWWDLLKSNFMEIIRNKQ